MGILRRSVGELVLELLVPCKVCYLDDVKVK